MNVSSWFHSIPPEYLKYTLSFSIIIWCHSFVLFSFLRDVADESCGASFEEIPLPPSHANKSKPDSSIIPSTNRDKDGRPSHCLSLIIPAFNEELRLPKMLDETLHFLRKRRPEIARLIKQALNAPLDEKDRSDVISTSFEIIIVDDGSSDSTINIAKSYSDAVCKDNSCDELRVIRLKRNSGKGCAIRTGMLLNNAEFALMVDADGATDICDLLTLLKAMVDLLRKNKSSKWEQNEWERGSIPTLKVVGRYQPPPIPALVVGSRAHLHKHKRSQLRMFLMHSFHFFVRLLCTQNIEDTQCGFKLFNRTAALQIFSQMHLNRWAFDIEMVYVAESLQFLIHEVDVRWREIGGSKLDTGKIALGVNCFRMLRDMFFVRVFYTVGLWKLKRRT